MQQSGLLERVLISRAGRGGAGPRDAGDTQGRDGRRGRAVRRVRRRRGVAHGRVRVPAHPRSGPGRGPGAGELDQGLPALAQGGSTGPPGRVPAPHDRQQLRELRPAASGSSPATGRVRRRDVGQPHGVRASPNATRSGPCSASCRRSSAPRSSSATTRTSPTRTIGAALGCARGHGAQPRLARARRRCASTRRSPPTTSEQAGSTS